LLVVVAAPNTLECDEDTDIDLPESGVNGTERAR
jgi:hypothetical protein